MLLGYVVGFGYSALRAGLSVRCDRPRVPTMGGVAESGGGALPMRPGFPKKAFSSECACGVRDP